MIQLQNVKKVFRTEEVETWALREVNLHVQEGEFVAIMGPSGCGKSTLLNILGLLDNPTEGTYMLNGKDVSKLQENERTDLRKGVIGFVFQSFNLIEELNVMENIELPLLYMGISRSERRRRVQEIMERVGIAHRSKHFPCQLSGGQQQRVAIARALALSPDILCFDEPTSALDPELTGEVLKVIRGLAEQKTTMIIVTHEMAFARDVADQIIFMDDGLIVEQGDPKQVIDNPQEERTKQFLTRYTEG
ncbi:MAG: amino acid ABC transporter ATP-binding protein [Paraprevotella sp.]|nr:amino acid ABC transporter ATP-binding protein [Paraprevotella sp.]